MKKAFLLLFCTILLGFTTSCLNDGGDPGPTIKAAASVDLNTENEIPMVENREETGVFKMILYQDNSLEFSITLNDLAGSDNLTVAHIHSGDPVSTGAPVITLVDGSSISFQGNQAIGNIQLTETEVAALLGGDVYVNVHSADSPAGLVRGQLDKQVNNAFNVVLSPDNEIPAITDRNDSGMAIFRVVGEEVYYKVTVSDLEATDAITAGHIHLGDATENGEVFINLEITDASQLDVTKTITLDENKMSKLLEDPLYVNIHSTDHASGLMRGQIR
ncbi:CHRD domain-containing protein [Aureibaculum conchae]|uniref:CHRD domain-containing protein n=1 Tax=Aureibaculum sp. 2308TA14-22 TaxID=3108392 RepID=UPI00339B28E9